MTDSILEVIHETAQGLHKAGVMDAETLREFDILCEPGLEKAPVEPPEQDAKPAKIPLPQKHQADCQLIEQTSRH